MWCSVKRFQILYSERHSTQLWANMWSWFQSMTFWTLHCHFISFFTDEDNITKPMMRCDHRSNQLAASWLLLTSVTCNGGFWTVQLATDACCSTSELFSGRFTTGVQPPPDVMRDQPFSFAPLEAWLRATWVGVNNAVWLPPSISRWVAAFKKKQRTCSSDLHIPAIKTKALRI